MSVPISMASRSKASFKVDNKPMINPDQVKEMNPVLVSPYNPNVVYNPLIPKMDPVQQEMMHQRMIQQQLHQTLPPTRNRNLNMQTPTPMVAPIPTTIPTTTTNSASASDPGISKQEMVAMLRNAFNDVKAEVKADMSKLNQAMTEVNKRVQEHAQSINDIAQQVQSLHNTPKMVSSVQGVTMAEVQALLASQPKVVNNASTSVSSSSSYPPRQPKQVLFARASPRMLDMNKNHVVEFDLVEVDETMNCSLNYTQGMLYNVGHEPVCVKLDMQIGIVGGTEQSIWFEYFQCDQDGNITIESQNMGAISMYNSTNFLQSTSWTLVLKPGDRVSPMAYCSSRLGAHQPFNLGCKVSSAESNYSSKLSCFLL